MNALGALIVELCDGSRSVEDIRALVGPLLPEGQSDEIARWIGDAVDTGLLFWGGPARELSVDELSTLAGHFQGNGKCEAAYQCAKRVTELKPENADAWYALGWAAKAAGRRTEAGRAFEKYLASGANDAAIRHMLKALKDEPPPPRASDDCVVQTFRNFSAYYDDKMRNNLSYQAPERLDELIREEIVDAAGLEILDIGCGTGLAGAVLKQRAASMVGIDLSPEMVELARARGIYNRLEVAEITEWLDRATEPFDLIVACDCLVYFGDLEPIAELVWRRLKPGGRFAFTTERGEQAPYHLSDSGRYTHHPNHVREVAARNGLTVERLDEGFLRTEYGLEVTGLIALLRKPISA